MRPLATDTWDDDERQAILDVVKSGRYTMGDRVAKFEQAYADYVGCRYCVAVNSGSSANLLMVAAYTLRYGKGTVIVPAVGWSTSYSPFQQYGWKLVFVDIDRSTLNYDLPKLWYATEHHEADAILAINLLGNPNDYNAFPRKTHILEDNCEAMGAEYDGRKTGSFGVMSTHSTFFSHHICTMEGGMVTTNDEYFYHMLLSLRAHGWTRNLPEKNKLNAKVGMFNFVLPGYNVRPTEMQAAIGLKQLEKLPRLIAARRENATRFPANTQREIGKSSWFGFAVFGDERKWFKGYESRPIVTGNFLRQPVLKYYDYTVFGETPNADYVDQEGMMIGNSGEPINWILD
jgi:CDP-6-deoxy-D-xylo-4-hexulose-3-dehydrase